MQAVSSFDCRAATGRARPRPIRAGLLIGAAVVFGLVACEEPPTSVGPGPEPVQPHPAPRINTVLPFVAYAGGARFTLEVLGTDFVPASVIRWNGNDRPTTFDHDGRLTATIEGGDIPAQGVVSVAVWTPAPGGGLSNAMSVAIEQFIPMQPPPPTRITAAPLHSCAIAASGVPYCWGGNGYGELGDGTTRDRPTPVAVVGAPIFTSIAAGFTHGCGLTANGSAYCWGSNDHGQLGEGTQDNFIHAPVPVAGGHAFTSLSLGTSHACGVATTGTAYCWGSYLDDFEGRNGNGTGRGSLAPLAVAGGLRFNTVSTGYIHTCGLTTAGAAWCWGSNSQGQLGVPNPPPGGISPISYLPVTVSGGLEFSALSTGGRHTCALTRTGAAYCWGEGIMGQLGTGSAVPFSTTPLPVSGGLSFVAINSDVMHTCGITASGAVYCWGANSSGQTGPASDTCIGSTPCNLVPRLIPGLPAVTQIATGWDHTCALANNGNVYCWGDRGSGQLGTGTAVYRTTPTAVAGGLKFRWLDATFQSSCAVTISGTTQCWGGTGNASVLVPTAVPGTPEFATIDGSRDYACGLTPAGAAYCWGPGGFGQLGNGGTTSSSTPVAVSGAHAFRAITVGGTFSCGLTLSQTAHCWGLNMLGQLGTGTNQGPERCPFGPPIACSTVPAPVADGHAFVTLSAGAVHGCGITTANVAYCWGRNSYGQLGDGSKTDNPRPVRAGGNLAFMAISAAEGHTCALTTAGAAYCWGYNSHGQLGDGTTTSSEVPIKVATSQTFVSIHAGINHSCGLTAQGAAYCWGNNAQGALGVAQFKAPSPPVAVSGGHTFASIATGSAHTCGLTASGDAYCWGLTDRGQVGDGVPRFESTPRLVEGGIVFQTAPFLISRATHR